MPRKLPDKLFTPKEKDIERACSDLMKLDGWRMIVTDPPQLRGLGVSEKGIPDRLYIRYGLCGYLYAKHMVETRNILDGPFEASAEVIWVEWKRPGGVLSPVQGAWHMLEDKRGALTWIAGHDFPASVDGFLEFYRASGLNRRPI